MQEKKKTICFPDSLKRLSSIQEEKPTRQIIGGQMHEIFKICDDQEMDPFDFTHPFLNILLSDLSDV